MQEHKNIRLYFFLELKEPNWLCLTTKYTAVGVYTRVGHTWQTGSQNDPTADRIRLDKKDIATNFVVMTRGWLECILDDFSKNRRKREHAGAFENLFENLMVGAPKTRNGWNSPIKTNLNILHKYNREHIETWKTIRNQLGGSFKMKTQWFWVPQGINKLCDGFDKSKNPVSISVTLL